MEISPKKKERKKEREKKRGVRREGQTRVKKVSC